MRLKGSQKQPHLGMLLMYTKLSLAICYANKIKRKKEITGIKCSFNTNQILWVTKVKDIMHL